MTMATTSRGRWQEAVGPVRNPEVRVAALRYDINEIGEMHHNPAKNVLYVGASV